MTWGWFRGSSVLLSSLRTPAYLLIFLHSLLQSALKPQTDELQRTAEEGYQETAGDLDYASEVTIVHQRCNLPYKSKTL